MDDDEEWVSVARSSTEAGSNTGARASEQADVKIAEQKEATTMPASSLSIPTHETAKITPPSRNGPEMAESQILRPTTYNTVPRNRLRMHPSNYSVVGTPSYRGATIDPLAANSVHMTGGYELGGQRRRGTGGA